MFRQELASMTRTGILLLALIVVSATAMAAPAAPATPATRDGDRLAVAFFTAAFLVEVTTRLEANRLLEARLSGGYLQAETGLIWTRQDNGADVDWYAADEHCRDLELADWADWRLPTIDELERLHVRRSNARYKLPPAIRLTGCCPWSRTRSGDASAWNFSFRYRKRFSGSLNYSFELRALCVRGASEADALFYEQAAEALEEKRRS